MVFTFLVTFLRWMTLVASIVSLKGIASESQTALATLFVMRLIPGVVMSSVGGVLADAMDRRLAMIQLDVIGAVEVCNFTHDGATKGVSQKGYVPR
jgi:hypothetical protein